MEHFVSEHIEDVIAVIAFAIGTGTLTIVGLLTEQAGIHNVIAGQSTLGLWETFMGAVVLYAGLYLLGYRNFLPRLLELRQQLH